jgi:hypothetical protein
LFKRTDTAYDSKLFGATEQIFPDMFNKKYSEGTHNQPADYDWDEKYTVDDNICIDSGDVRDF